MAVVTLTDGEIQSGLQSGYKLGPLQFTFSIPGVGSTWETTAGNYTGTEQQPFTNYSTLNATEAANFRLALAAWDNLITPNFSEVADNAAGHGEVRVAFTSDQMGAGTAAYAFQGSNQTPTSIVGDVWINSNSVGDSFNVGTNDYTTFLHEIGHVLGLKHPFEAPTLPAYDDTRYTVMSYTTPYVVLITPGGGGYSIAWNPVSALTPQVLDIAAVQATYGVNTNYNNGDTTYTFTQGDIATQSIYDSGGTDTIDLSSFTRNNIIDLEPGGYSSVGYWSKSDQIAFYASLTGDTQANISSYYSSGPTPNAYYEWNDDLGIAFNTTIENAIGGSGNDTITGNDADNLFYLQHGGGDTVTGGLGEDGFYFGAALTAADSVDGGAGTADQVGLQGDYSGGLTLGAGNLVNIETLVLLPGSDTRFGDTAGNLYSYDLTTVDANVAAGQQLTVNWNTLQAGENVTFDGSAELNGKFLTYAAKGDDHITGGQQDDGFYFGFGNWGSGDSVDGQGGTMDQLGLQGNYAGGSAIVFGASQLSGIEAIVCLPGSDGRFGVPAGSGYSYDLTMDNGNVAAGQTMYINANTLLAAGGTLTSDETLTFNGSAETDGHFIVYSGAGADTIVGGGLDDQVWGGAGADAITGGLGADSLHGAAGNDAFLYTATNESTSASMDQILDFTSGDHIDLSAIDAIAGGGNDAFAFIGATAFSDTAGELRAVEQTAGHWMIEGDTDGNGVADLVIAVTTTDAHTLATADFVL